MFVDERPSETPAGATPASDAAPVPSAPAETGSPVAEPGKTELQRMLAATDQPAERAARRSRWQGLGMAVAVVLAFVWGGIAYRELAPARSVARVIPGVAAAAVKGSEAPPQWINEFAVAFCSGDAKKLAPRIGPPLTNNVEAISNALQDRDWSCNDIRFAGGGANPKGNFFLYITTDSGKGEQWWVFTVAGDQVVAID
jgi:hypothetical protein